MLGSVLALTFGLLLVAGGIFGRRFTVGLSARTRVSPWYGRTWLIGGGLLAIFAGASGLVQATGPKSEFLAHIGSLGSKAECVFYAAFEAYNGIGLMIVGLVLSTNYFGKRDWKLFWLFTAFVVGGSIFGYDGLWTLIKGCPH